MNENCNQKLHDWIFRYEIMMTVEFFNSQDYHHDLSSLYERLPSNLELERRDNQISKIWWHVTLCYELWNYAIAVPFISKRNVGSIFIIELNFKFETRCSKSAHYHQW